MTNSPIQSTSKHEPIELTLARLLRLGSLLAALLISGGIVMMVLGSERLATHLITAGLTVLLATPIMRVVTAGLIFVRQRDWRFAGFCLVVIIALAIGILLGNGGG